MFQSFRGEMMGVRVQRENRVKDEPQVLGGRSSIPGKESTGGRAELAAGHRDLVIVLLMASVRHPEGRSGGQSPVTESIPGERLGSEVELLEPEATRKESKPWGCLFGESMTYEERRPRPDPRKGHLDRKGGGGCLQKRRSSQRTGGTSERGVDVGVVKTGAGFRKGGVLCRLR